MSIDISDTIKYETNNKYKDIKKYSKKIFNLMIHTHKTSTIYH